MAIGLLGAAVVVGGLIGGRSVWTESSTATGVNGNQADTSNFPVGAVYVFR